MIRLLSAEMNKVVSENHQHQHCLIQILCVTLYLRRLIGIGEREELRMVKDSLSP